MTEITLPESPLVVLSSAEWSEISNCASALFAALECFQSHPDEAWDLVISVQQRLQRAMAPVEERLSDEVHGD